MNMSPLIVGIDATNIGSGGGLLHLSRILEEYSTKDCRIKVVVVWGSEMTLENLPKYSWVIRRTHSWLNKNLFFRILWQIIHLSNEVKLFKCDSIFCPGGISIISTGIPIISMAQNLLPFDSREVLRFGFSLLTLKLLLLRYIQAATFRSSIGIIFLSQYSKNHIEKEISLVNKSSVVIPHGVDQKFFLKKEDLIDRKKFNESHPLRVLYVSPIWPYKNHENVVLATSILRLNGLPLRLDLVGGACDLPTFRRLNKKIQEVNDPFEFIFYHQNQPHENIINFYNDADIFVFASSCESFGQIITEAMAAKLPIACSSYSSMTEILGDGGVYFNPFDHKSLCEALERLIESPPLRHRTSSIARERAGQYSWERCSRETFSYLELTTEIHRRKLESEVLRLPA